MEKQMSLPKLICLPYAGGSHYVFAPWMQSLDGQLDVRTPELPGRGLRIMEEPISRLSTLVEWLRHELRDVLAGDFSFWGHSMGALLAYELTRSLAAHGQAQPRHLFLSGALPPQLPRHAERYHELDDTKLIEKVAQMGGTPDEVLADRELMALLLPTLRADFTVCETYTWQSEPSAVHVPMTVIGGDRDPDVALAKLQGWRNCTHATVRVIEMVGDHFFLRNQIESLCDVFTETLISPVQLRTAG